MIIDVDLEVDVDIRIGSDIDIEMDVDVDVKVTSITSRQSHCQGCCQCYIYRHLCSSVYNITDGPQFKMRQLSMQDYQKEIF